MCLQFLSFPCLFKSSTVWKLWALCALRWPSTQVHLLRKSRPCSSGRQTTDTQLRRCVRRHMAGTYPTLETFTLVSWSRRCLFHSSTFASPLPLGSRSACCGESFWVDVSVLLSVQPSPRTALLHQLSLWQLLNGDFLLPLFFRHLLVGFLLQGKAFPFVTFIFISRSTWILIL